MRGSCTSGRMGDCSALVTCLSTNGCRPPSSMQAVAAVQQAELGGPQSADRWVHLGLHRKPAIPTRGYQIPGWDFFCKQFVLEYNCFLLLCQFVLYSKGNQQYVFTYPLFFGILSNSGHHRALIEFPALYRRFSLVMDVYSVHTISSIYMSVTVSQFIPPPPYPLGIHVCSLHLCVCFCFANRFICTIFLFHINILIYNFFFYF